MMVWRIVVCSSCVDYLMCLTVYYLAWNYGYTNTSSMDKVHLISWVVYAPHYIHVLPAKCTIDVRLDL